MWARRLLGHRLCVVFCLQRRSFAGAPSKFFLLFVSLFLCFLFLLAGLFFWGCLFFLCRGRVGASAESCLVLSVFSRAADFFVLV